MHRGQRLLFADKPRYFFYITNRRVQEASAADIVRDSNRRCAQEKIIEQLKNGVSAMRMPSDGLASNWAWMSIAAQAWNLKAWMGLLLPAELGARKLLRMHFRRFLLEVVQVPCQIVEQGRRLIFRLLSPNPWTPLLTQGCARLRAPAPG